MHLTRDQMNEIVDGLNGTCMSLHEGVRMYADVELEDVENELEFCEFLDNWIFSYHECGWWCEAGFWNTQHGEATGEDVCLHCMPEEDE